MISFSSYHKEEPKAMNTIDLFDELSTFCRAQECADFFYDGAGKFLGGFLLEARAFRCGWNRG